MTQSNGFSRQSSLPATRLSSITTNFGGLRGVLTSSSTKSPSTSSSSTIILLATQSSSQEQSKKGSSKGRKKGTKNNSKSKAKSAKTRAKQKKMSSTGKVKTVKVTKTKQDEDERSLESVKYISDTKTEKKEKQKEVPQPKWDGQKIAAIAAEMASKIRKEQARTQRSSKSGNTNFVASSPIPKKEKLGSLRDLTKAIDDQLRVNRNRNLASQLHQAQDSMKTLLEFNNENHQPSITTHDVALVFGKPLIQDQITLEYASRVRTLVKMMAEENYKPSLICFCGGIQTKNHVADADAGLIFFKHLCQSQNIDLKDVEFFVDRTSINEAEIIRRITQTVRQEYLESWGSSVSSQASTSIDEYYGLKTQSIQKRKIHIHVTLISTEYHLCSMNDVHARSPHQSFLRPIESLGSSTTNSKRRIGARKSSSSRSSRSSTDDMDEYYNGDDDDIIDPFEDSFVDEEDKFFRSSLVPHQIQISVESSWSFNYATYPYVYAKDDTVAFMGKCYLLGEQLLPLYVNMKGVVEDKEFFQRDNYLALSAIRRSLVTQVESLYKASTALRTGLKLTLVVRDPSAPRNFEAVLEGALLSLGRCIDIVRPAGLLVSSVSKSDWNRALRALKQCMADIRDVCDPDRPLEASEWGMMVDKVPLSIIDEVEEDKEKDDVLIEKKTMLLSEIEEDEEDNNTGMGEDEEGGDQLLDQFAIFCDE